MTGWNELTTYIKSIGILEESSERVNNIDQTYISKINRPIGISLYLVYII